MCTVKRIRFKYHHSMKTRLSLFAAFLVAGSSYGVDVQTFTSADGSKTLQASIERYNPSNGQAQIRVKGRVMNVPVAAFQSEDKLKFESWYQAAEVGRKLALTFDENESDGVEKKTSNAKVTTTNNSFKIKVRNNGQTDFTDVSLQYRLFYYRDKDKGGKEPAHADGTLSLASIAPRETKELETEPISLTRVRPLPASQCKGGT